MAEETLKLLCSPQKLDRDHGVRQLRQLYPNLKGDDIDKFTLSVMSIIKDACAPWESKHGALMAAKIMLSFASLENRAMASNSKDDFSDFMQTQSLFLLEDGESRVRLAAGEVLGTLCKRYGPSVYADCKDVILEGVHRNLERQPLHVISRENSRESVGTLMEKLSSPSSESGIRERRSSTSAEEIFHDTAGWKSLETWMRCLQTVIEGCGHHFNPHVDQRLLDLVFDSLNHTNRFVRETGYYVCASLVSIGVIEKENGELSCLSESNAIFHYGDQFSGHLADGLADNWSQVRLAASTAARKFLLSLPEESRQNFYPSILPRLCLNRYYVAEGVRIYNQDTWKIITAGQGRQLVEKYIHEVVENYISQTEADNHAVREAACACIAELGQKINKDVVRPHVEKLLQALLVCFHDESWPVRDASCVACGHFVLCFPEETRGVMQSLYLLFFDNLQDSIPSVRQGAAVALANVVRAYGQEAAELIITKIKEGLAGIEKQPENTEKYSSLEKGPGHYGVVKRARDNDMELHTDKQMYSCGSLAPKMHRGKRGGGCMDHQFRKPSEPWEMADGCVHLIAELSQNTQITQVVPPLLPPLAKAASFKHYTCHIQFLETLSNQLPRIGRGIGKRALKMYLEMFFEPIFYSLASDNALTSTAASKSLIELGHFLGPNILRGRIEQHDPRYLHQLDANMPSTLGPSCIVPP